MDNKIHTSEHYIASIDLLGVKNILNNDKDDSNLNTIYNIFHSWDRIIRDDKSFYPKHLEIKAFSDNLVLAIKADTYRAADKLLDTVSYMCFHFLRNGYKPRGGITKGKLYIDNVFVWGKGLLNAYKMESEEAKYPRILIDDCVLEDTSSHCIETLVSVDEIDDKKILNYFRCFGRSNESWPADIDSIIVRLRKELEGLDIENNQSIIEKLKWLISFAEKNKTYWEEQNK